MEEDPKCVICSQTRRALQGHELTRQIKALAEANLKRHLQKGKHKYRR